MCVKKVFLFGAIFAGYVSSISFTHTRRKRVSGKDFYDDPLHDDYNNDDYTMYESYEDYEYESFSCTDGRGKIPLILLCDRVVDCSDGSDEKTINCEGSDYTTASTTVSTTVSPIAPQNTAQEVVKPALNILDDYGEYPGCLEGEFQCLSDWSVCLPTAQVCDGIDDCPAKEDELGCLGKGPLESFDVENVETWVDSNKPAFKKAREHSQEPSDGSPEIRFTSSNSGEFHNSKVVFRAPSVTQRRHPLVMLPRKEEPNQLAAFQADYKYVHMKGDDCADCSRSGSHEKTPNIQSRKRIRARPTKLYQRRGHEIEINHATGEVKLIENDGTIPPFPVAFTLPHLLPTSHGKEMKSSVNYQQSEPKHGQYEDLGGDYIVQRQKLRGIVSELLHHIGDMLEADLFRDDEDDSSPPSKNFHNSPSENSLFVRIANVKTPLLFVNLELNL